MCDAVRSNVKPPTLQRSDTAPELKNHGALNVADVPGAIPAKLPSALSTNGLPVPPKPVHAVTSVAVAAEDESKLTPPMNVMLPEMGTAWATPAIPQTAAVAATIVNHFFFIFFLLSIFLLLVFVFAIVG
jgi:hypothetical protein